MNEAVQIIYVYNWCVFILYNHLPSKDIEVEVAMTPNAKDEDQANNEELSDRMMTGV